MAKYGRAIFYGFLAWTVPFVTAMFFHADSGQLTIDVFWFQSIMLTVGSAAAACFLVLYFKEVKDGFLREGIVVGLIWLGVSILWDFLITIHMSGISLSAYWAQIGLRYLSTTAMSIAIGAALANREPPVP